MRLRYRMARHGAEILRTGRVTPMQAQYIARKLVEDGRRRAHKARVEERKLTRNPKSERDGYIITDLSMFDNPPRREQ